MYLEKLAPAWREFHHKLLAQTCILVVDDEEVICELLSTVLTTEGFTVRTALTTTRAWEILTTERIDLAVVDKNLPDGSGLDVIRRIGKEGLAVPSVLITGYASSETVAEALEAGAEDYISKPFDNLQHLVKRLRLVIDRLISRLLFDVMINDLTRAVQGGAMESKTYADLSRELIAFKMELGRRTQVLIADRNTRCSDELEAELRTDAVSSIIAEERSEILSLVGRPLGPLAVVLALEMPKAITLIHELRENDPQIEILATAARGDLRVALQAVEAGAADYVLRASEGSAPISVRIKRLVLRARRHRLYMHLVATLYRAAKEANPNLADGLIFAASSDPGYVERNPITRAPAESNESIGSFESDYLEGGRIEGNPFGSTPLRKK